MIAKPSASRIAIAAASGRPAESKGETQTVPRRGTAADPLFLEGEAADYLGVSVRTVQKWRQIGGGPGFLKVNRSIRYRRSVLDAYLHACEHNSTSSYSQESAS